MAARRYVYDDGRKHYATTNPNEYWAEGVQAVVPLQFWRVRLVGESHRRLRNLFDRL